MKDRYVILLVDETILQHARRCGIRLVYILAKMTAYLKPCETHVFAKFEHAFRKLCRERSSLSPDGAISMRAWMQVVSSAIQQIHGRAGESCCKWVAGEATGAVCTRNFWRLVPLGLLTRSRQPPQRHDLSWKDFTIILIQVALCRPITGTDAPQQPLFSAGHILGPQMHG